MTSTTLSIILVVVISAALTFIANVGIKYLNQKIDLLQTNIKNVKLNSYIDMAQDSITTAVTSVNQTYVDSLKAAGTFDIAAQEKALALAKVTALNILGEDAKNMLKEAFGDLDAWITNKIEAFIKKSKSTSA